MVELHGPLGLVAAVPQTQNTRWQANFTELFSFFWIWQKQLRETLCWFWSLNANLLAGQQLSNQKHKKQFLDNCWLEANIFGWFAGLEKVLSTCVWRKNLLGIQGFHWCSSTVGCLVNLHENLAFVAANSSSDLTKSLAYGFVVGSKDDFFKLFAAVITILVVGYSICLSRWLKHNLWSGK